MYLINGYGETDRYYSCAGDRGGPVRRYINGKILGQARTQIDGIAVYLQTNEYAPRKVADMQTGRGVLIDAAIVMLQPRVDRIALWRRPWRLFDVAKYHIEPCVLPGAGH